MSIDIKSFVYTYGYWFIFLGAIIEGETFMIAGGLAAQQGLLDVRILIVLAIIGTTIHDNFFFGIGQMLRKKKFLKNIKIQKKLKLSLYLCKKYGIWIVIFFRFIYGMRTIIPSVIGIIKFPFLRFFIFDIIGGIIWSSCFILSGYFFGKVLENIIYYIHKYKLIYMFSIIIIIICVLTIYFIFPIYFKKKKKNNDS